MTDTTTTTPVARHSVGDIHTMCTPHLDGANLAVRFHGGRTENHDLTSFTVKASIGSYQFESGHTSFTLTFVDKSTGAAMSAVAASAGALAVLGSAAGGLSAGDSAARHIQATNALVVSGYNDFYGPLKAVAGQFKESWRTRPTMLVRYALIWVTLPFFVGGSVALLFAGAMLGILMPSMMISVVLADRPIPETLLGCAMAFVAVVAGVLWVPIGRVATTGMLGMFAQNYWATPPQQAAHIDATVGTSADDRHRLRNTFFYNRPRWISVAAPYLALLVGLATLLRQRNNPDIDVANDGPVLGTVILFVFIGVQFAYAIKILIESRTLQCDEAAWVEANITAENSLMTRSNLVPLLRHGVFAGLLLIAAAAVFALV